MSSQRPSRAVICLTLSFLGLFVNVRAQSPHATSEIVQTIQLLNGSLATPARRSGMHPLLATPERLLLERRATLMRQLIERNPEAVRAAMLPPEVAAALTSANPEIASLLEQEVTISGELTHQIADDFDTHATTELLELHVTDRPGADLRVHLADPFASIRQHVRMTITGIELGGSIAAESLTPALPAPQPDGRRENTRQHPGTAASTSSSALTCSPTGEQHVAVLMLRFPNNFPAFSSTYTASTYWQNAITGRNLSVSDYWNALSYGKTTASADVYNPIQIPQSYSCQDYLSLRTAALQAAAASVDLSKYNRIVLAFPTSSCAYGGLADVGCNAADTLVNHPYSVVWLPVLTRYGPDVAMWSGLSHELGHNLGLNHANTLDFGDIAMGPLDFQSTHPGIVIGSGATTAAGAVTAVDTEYGDSFSAMGIPWTGGPYSANHRTHLLGWIASSGADTGAATVASSGRYTLLPAEQSTGLRALRILRDGISSSWLWVEYHQPDNSYTSANLLQITGQNATAGATVHYENGYGDPDKTWQLDMTPESPAHANTFADGALLPGKSWSDPYSPLKLSAESATTTALTVNVEYDTPCATFTIPSQAIAAAGGSGTIAVSAPSGCTWSAFTNATWLTLTGTTSGSGNGSFSWTATPNSGTAQRITFLSVGRRSTRLLQLGTGASIVSLLPENGSAAPGDFTVFTLNIAGPEGLADLQQVELAATGSGTDPCTVLVSNAASAPTLYLYNRTEDAYSAGLSAGAGGTIAIPGCTLSGARSAVSVQGSAIRILLDLSFPSTQPGVRSFFATTGASDPLPVGIFNVGAAPLLPPPPSPVTVLSTTALSATPAAAIAGSPVTLTAIVTTTGTETGTGAGNVSTPRPRGTVRFVENSADLGTATVDGSGAASLVLTSLIPGTHSIIATYSGDAVFPGSTSPVATVVIGKRTPALTINLSSTRALAHAPVVLTISIAGSASGQVVTTATGTALLREGTTSLGVATFSNTGTASFPLPTLPPGNHMFTAEYSGDAFNNPASASGPALLIMDFALTAPASPLAMKAGATLGNTATVMLTPETGGFPVNVALTCTGAPLHSTCSITPNAVTPGVTSVPLTVTVHTTAAASQIVSAASQASKTDSTHPRHVNARALLAIGALPLFTCWIRRRRSPHNLPAKLLLLIASAMAVGGLAGCGSGGTIVDAPANAAQNTTPTGTYGLTITGTATDGGAILSHSVSLSLQVN